MFLQNKEKYSLNYIENIFSKIPIVFILTIAIVSMLIAFILLDFKKSREIGLLIQKSNLQYQFEKRNSLNNFLQVTEKIVDIKISKEKENLKKATFEMIGFLKNAQYEQFYTKDLNAFIDSLEKRYKFNFIFFSKDDYKIFYGNNFINYAQALIFGDNNSEKSKEITIKYIISQGKNNLQHWKDEIKSTVKLSYFDSFFLNEKEYIIGFSSTIQSLKKITVESLKEMINKNSLDFWLYDLNMKSAYNFYGKEEYQNCKDILKFNINEGEYLDLKEYCNDNYENNSLKEKYHHFYKKYDYIVKIRFNEEIVKIKLKDEIKELKSEYNNLIFQIFVIIVVISAVLILLTSIFISYVKNVFNLHYDELKDKSNTLEHWKKRFELAIIASNDGLWDINLKNNQIFFSQKWLEMFGYSEDEIKSFDDWFNLIHNQDKLSVKKLFDEVFSTKNDSIICEYRLRSKKEGFKWVMARGKAFKDENGNLDRMLMMSMDIDKSKRMIKELLDVELLVEDGETVLFKFRNDEKLSTQFISKSIKRFGFTKKNFEENFHSFLDLVYDEDKTKVLEIVNGVLKNDLKDFSFECRIKDFNKQILWISLRAITIKNHSGEVIHFYGYFNDITKIKLNQEELEQRVQKELTKNREKDRILIQQSKLASMGEMLGAIAHQWRQPLNNVNLILQFLNDYFNSEKLDKQKVEKYINNAKKNIDYMSQTIDDFRDFYKPSKNKNLFKLKDSLNSVLFMVNHELNNLEIDVQLKCEEIEVCSYENELKQSLLNILNNAKDAISKRKESEDFKAFISINVIKNGDKIEITISNNGGHIPNEIIERIFEPYFTTKFEDKGTGIGLYMTKSIIENNLRGSIKVKNYDEKSVVFKINIENL